MKSGILRVAFAMALMLHGMAVEASVSGDSLPVPRWEQGSAIIMGKTLNYDRAKDDNPNAQVYPRSSFGRYADKKHATMPVDSAGNYRIDVKLYQTHQPCYIDVPGYYGLMYISPGDEVELTVDYALRHANGHCGPDGSVRFAGGEDSDLNDMLATETGHNVIWNNFNNNDGFRKQYSGNDEFVEAVMAHRASQYAHVDTLPLAPRMKQLLRLNIDNDAAISQLMAPIYGIVTPDSAYYSFLQAYGVHDPMLRWASSYDSMIGYCSRLSLSDDFEMVYAQTDADIFENILSGGKLSAQDTELVEGALSYNIDRLPQDVLSERCRRLGARVSWLCDSIKLDDSGKVSAGILQGMLADNDPTDARKIVNAYLKFISHIEMQYGLSLPEYYAEIRNDDFGRRTSDFFKANEDALMALYDSPEFRAAVSRYDMMRYLRRFTDLTGIDDDLLRQNMIIHQYSDMIGNGKLVPKEVFDEEIKGFSPVAVAFLSDQNEALRQVLDKAVSNVCQMSPDDDADKIILDLVEKHKGKILFIDIWNTWCGACIGSMVEHEKVKGDYTDQVAFVYLADETSPEGAWNERIKGFTGDHYRLPLAQHQSLMQRFNFSGYPSYIIVDKNGEIVHTGYIHSLSELDRWLK